GDARRRAPRSARRAWASRAPRRLDGSKGRRMSVLLAAVLALSMTTTNSAKSEVREAPADLVLVSAKIWTGDLRNPEAEALAVRGGKIVAVGADKQIEAVKGPQAKVLDAKWRR